MRREIADVYGLMDRATQSNWLGDTEVAKKAIKDACDKLDQFTSSPPAPQPSSDPPSIVMLRKQRAYPGVPIHFVVANRDPKWTSTSTYTWEWSGQRPTAKEALKRVFTGAEQKPAKPLSKEELDNQDWRLLFKAQDLRDITTPFWKPGQYTVRLTVDSAQVAVRSFRLDKDQSVGFLSRIAISDSLILLLAVVFAAILSYLAIDKLETFGSISDYALAFLGGFGLNATTSGFSAVISRFQGRPPS
jgi:hypothetical protein